VRVFLFENDHNHLVYLIVTLKRTNRIPIEATIREEERNHHNRKYIAETITRKISDY